MSTEPIEARFQLTLAEYRAAAREAAWGTGSLRVFLGVIPLALAGGIAMLVAGRQLSTKRPL